MCKMMLLAQIGVLIMSTGGKPFQKKNIHKCIYVWWFSDWTFFVRQTRNKLWCFFFSHSLAFFINFGFLFFQLFRMNVVSVMFSMFVTIRLKTYRQRCQNQPQYCQYSYSHEISFFSAVVVCFSLLTNK